MQQRVHAQRTLRLESFPAPRTRQLIRLRQVHIPQVTVKAVGAFKAACANMAHLT
jgi:hypothetical protein